MRIASACSCDALVSEYTRGMIRLRSSHRHVEDGAVFVFACTSLRRHTSTEASTEASQHLRHAMQDSTSPALGARRLSSRLT